jgi:uncharacterized protein YkwD
MSPAFLPQPPLPRSLSPLATLLVTALVACGTPSKPPPVLPGNEVDQAAFIAAVNSTRASAQSCTCNEQCNKNAGYPLGSAVVGPVKTVKLNDRLTQAALVQANDMREHGFFSHTGSDNSSVVNRVINAGYAPVAAAETIAGNQKDIAEVVSTWLGQTNGHCNAVMDNEFAEIGMAKLSGSASSPLKSYWVLVLAKPQ